MMRDEKKPIPIFSIPSQPLDIDAALAALDPSVEVEYTEEHAGHRGSGRQQARQLLAYIGGIIDRQSKGFYTLQEAAQAIADANQGLDSSALLLKLKEAFFTGILTVRNPATQAPHKDGATLRDFSDWVTPEDIDEVLSLWRVTYRFPCKHARPEEATPQARRATLDITTQRGCRRLILEQWDSIEALYGPNADGRQVLRVLNRNADPAQKPYTLKTVQNKLGELRKELLVP